MKEKRENKAKEEIMTAMKEDIARLKGDKSSLDKKKQIKRKRSTSRSNSGVDKLH